MQVLRYVAFILMLLGSSGMLASADANRDRFQTSRDIRVESDEHVGDVTCLNCSIYVRGQVGGDILAIHGNVVLYEGAQIGGDIASLAGNVRLESGTQVGGDVAAIGGTVRRDSGAKVGGDVASTPGAGWVAVIFALPLLFIGAIVALIIWLVQRNRRTTQGVRPLAA
jgi:predicted acyltransferase (DUF342 family)